MTTQFDLEVEQLEEDLACGNISLEDYNRQLRTMERDYRAEAQEAAEQAYDNEMERW